MADYIWPISKNTTPDEMNTSFGPRIYRDRWTSTMAFDLPAPIGTPVYALRRGIVHHAGLAGTGGYSPRHVVLEVNGNNISILVYVHLDSIAEAILKASSQPGTAPRDGGMTVRHTHICI